MKKERLKRGARREVCLKSRTRGEMREEGRGEEGREEEGKGD